MVTDQEISQALQSLFKEPSDFPNTFGASGRTTLNDVVQQLESKLGLDLTHKTDFIRTQIQILFSSHPTQPPTQLHLQHHLRQSLSPQSRDHFAPHQNPNFHPTPSSFQSLSSPAPSPRTGTDAVTVSEQPKESARTQTKRRGGPGGLNKICGVSPELQAIVGHPTLPRTEIVKQLWAYIRKNNLQDPSNKRKIICNDELRLVFETDCTDMFKMNKLLAKHIIALEPTKKSAAPKKPKVVAESETNCVESGPYVMISEVLANFFGVDQKEMLQSEVLRCIWDYIKLNNLEVGQIIRALASYNDPLNQMAIICDAKLQKLFGCQSISALGIPEVLASHHIFRRS